MSVSLVRLDANVGAPTSRTGRMRWAALAAICLAELLVVMDNTLVNTALPSMAVQLGARVSGLQWIVDAYTLAFSGLLLANGHLGDRFGRRRLLLIGLIGVAVMSGAGAMATTLGEVIGARVGMGVFAAAVLPATLALIINIFTDTKERTAGIAAWTAMAGFAVAIGPVTSGWLLEHFTWHSVFWVNIPVAALAIVAVLITVAESRVPQAGSLDVVGIALSLTGVTALVWTIIGAPGRGWLAPTSMLGYVVSVSLLTAYVRWELRVGAPVLDVRLFRIRRFALPSLAIAVGFFSIFGFLFLITQYFQGVREYTPLQFGIHSLPFAAAVAVGAPVATVLARVLGTTAVVTFGLLVLAAGMYVAGQVTVDTPYTGAVLISMILLGIGFAVVSGAATDSIMNAVPETAAGAGSAVNDTTREVGGALGVAVLGSVMTSVYSGKVGALLNAVPAGLMSPSQKDIARDTPISVLAIIKAPTPPLVAEAKANLVHAMKVASLQGSHAASLVTVSALILCAVVVAVLLPWKPHGERVGRSSNPETQTVGSGYAERTGDIPLDIEAGGGRTCRMRRH